jgi:hypothetical protein
MKLGQLNTQSHKTLTSEAKQEVLSISELDAEEKKGGNKKKKKKNHPNINSGFGCFVNTSRYASLY